VSPTEVTSTVTLMVDGQLTLWDEEQSIAWCAWLAGLLDGEGCITIRPQRRSTFLPAVRVVMCDEEPVTRLYAQYGGSFVLRPRPAPWRDAFSWQVTGRACQQPLKDALPYLVVKHRQAALVLEVAQTVTPYVNHHSATVCAFRQAHYLAVKVLNQRGKA
jgi:hypothetical protein